MSGRYAGYNALLIGGETTPTLPEKPGKGGRNQHYAACTMPLMESYPGDWVVASVGTDGSDFMPDVAGAMVDSGCLRNIKEVDPDFGNKLTCYDSNTVLGCADNALIVTGSTHTNVGDVVLYLLENRNG
jgi:glycerate-2-kinase